MASLTAYFNRDARVIGLVCFPHGLSHFYYMVLPPMFAVLKTAFGLNNLEIGLFMTIFATAAAIGQTPVGFLVDKIGGRQVLICGLLLESIAIGSIGLAESYWQLLALGAIAGIGHTVYHPADFAIMTSLVSNKRMGRAFGIHSFTGYLGFAAAPLFMTAISELWNWQAAFMLAGVLGLIAASLLWLNSALLREMGADSGRPEKAEQDSQSESQVGQGIKLLFTAPMIACFLYYVLHQMGNGGLRTFLGVALWELYATPQVIAGMALTGLMAGTAGGILAGGFLADRTGPQIWVACMTLVPSALLIALVGAFEMPLIVLVLVITAAGFLMGLLLPSRDLLLRSVTPDGSMGKAMGFVSTGSNVGGAIIPVVLGWVMDNSNPRYIFWITAGMIAAALFTFITVKGVASQEFDRK
ncbi:MAG: MFS transporter [Rhodospirillales bacterium]|nr:MFS transporter [Rhodospirillales bacterium]